MFGQQAGEVKITKKSPSGDVAIATLDKGDIFGEMALFDKMPRSATAVAACDARVLSIDKSKLFSTISRDPTLVFKILESMSKRIRGLNEEFAKFRKNQSGIQKRSFSLGDVCGMLLEESKNIVEADNGSIMVLEEDGKSLSIQAAFGSESECKVKLVIGEGIAGDVLKTGRAEMVNNAVMDPRFVKGKTQIRSMLCVPLKCNGCVFGVMNLSNTKDRLFSLDDLKLLSSLAVHASIAIQNSINLTALRNATDDVLRHTNILTM